MKEDKIKEAFTRAKDDILNLRTQISELRDEVFEIKGALNGIYDWLNALKLGEIPSQKNSTDRQINSTDLVYSTQISTVPQEIEGLKGQNLGSSTGNEGVSTDRQTDNSTDRQTRNTLFSEKNNIEDNIHEASEILDSLDKLKKEIRLKFKRITPREMAVFSTIYQLEEEDPNSTTYKEISKKLGLSQSSIRDYIQGLINKGIPVKKAKIDNKKVIFSISPDLKKIASLSTIIKLRDL